MTSPRKAYFVARVAVLLVAAHSVAMTSAWIITSPGTIMRICAKSSPCRSSSSFIHMSSSGSEGGSNSYEEQYATFAQQHQAQNELQPFAQANQIGDEDIPNPILNPSTNYLDPIREATPNASSKLDVDRKSQEELEMAFLDFISCSSYESQVTSSLYDVGSEQQENPQYDLYADSSTTLAFGSFVESDEGTKNDTNDDIEDASRTDPSAFVSTAPLTDSDPRYGAKDYDIASTTEFASSSASLSTDSTAASTTNSLNNDGAPAFATAVDAASKELPLSASTSYIDNIESVSVMDDERSDVADIIDGVDPNSDPDSDDNYYTVEVRVETTFPTGITVEDAKCGWLEFCWAKGGGIVVPSAESEKPPSVSNTDSKQANHAPDTIKFETEEESNNDEVQDHESSSSSIDVELPTGIPSSRELIIPLGMKQQLVSSTSTLDEIQTDTIRRDVLTYKSTDTGLFCKDMIENTHEGRVEFIGASYTATRMIWTVMFQVEQEEEDFASNQDTTNVMDFASATKTKVETMISKANLWGSWSQFQLKTASQNLIAYMDNSADAIPVLEHTETLPVGVSPREAMEAWYAYYWKNGGGAIPIIASRRNGIDKRWIIPTGLEEEMVSLEYDRPVSESESVVVGVDGEITTETEIAKAVYKVNNPNLLTYPVHYNRATVRFLREGEESPTRLIWKVQVKPYRKILAGGVLFWTKNNITLAARNLRKYLEIRQLEREERELQDQLKQLRTQNPASSSSGSRSDDKKENYDEAEKKLFEGLKTIRSTLSISSAQAALAIEDKEEPASTGNNENNSDNTTVDEENGDWQSLQKNPEVRRPASPGVVVDEKTPASTVKLHDEEERTTRSMFIPDFSSIERATMVIDTNTHAVNDKGTRGIWQ